MSRPTDARHERGAILIVFTVIVVAIMAAATLAVDGGLLYKDRSDDQNAADHAALAAGWADCNGQDPIAAGLAAAKENGFDDASPTVGVTITSLGSRKWEAAVESHRPPAFGGTQGTNDLVARAWATAECVPGGTGVQNDYAIFATANGCTSSGDDTIKFAGSNLRIDGATHSNGVLYVSGSNSVFDGRVTYTFPPASVSGSNNTFSDPPDPTRVTSKTNPFAGVVSPGQYQSGGAVWARTDPDGDGVRQFLHNAGSAKIDMPYMTARPGYNAATKTFAPGLYVTTGSIELGSLQGHNGQVTLVSLGGDKIQFSSSDLTALSAWDPVNKLLAYATEAAPCKSEGIDISGSNSEFNGYLYAPDALVKISGSGNSSTPLRVNGAIVGETVFIEGQWVTVNLESLLSPGGPPGVYIRR